MAKKKNQTAVGPVGPKVYKDRKEILADLAANLITAEEAGKAMDTLPPPPRALYCKVSPKGACSLYGLQRMPVTLYKEQWPRLLEYGPQIMGFIQEHDGELKGKGDKPEPAKAA